MQDERISVMFFTFSLVFSGTKRREIEKWSEGSMSKGNVEIKKERENDGWDLIWVEAYLDLILLLLLLLKQRGGWVFNNKRAR